MNLSTLKSGNFWYKTLWAVFVFQFVFAISLAGAQVTWPGLDDSVLLHTLALSMPIFLLFVHAFLLLSVKRALFFIFLAALLGFVSEYLGLTYGVFFGGRYEYKFDPISVAGVPVKVMAFWAFFIYSGNSLTNSFFVWVGRELPKFQRLPNSVIKNIKGFVQVITLSVIDAIFVTNIDFFMDPFQVRAGEWTWFNVSGGFFGVPWGNFIGWFNVALLTCVIFRLLQFVSPVSHAALDLSANDRETLYLVPAVGYGMLAVIFAVISLGYEMYAETVVGLTLMLPASLASLSYRFWNKNRESFVSRRS